MDTASWLVCHHAPRIVALLGLAAIGWAVLALLVSVVVPLTGTGVSLPDLPDMAPFRWEVIPGTLM